MVEPLSFKVRSTLAAYRIVAPDTAGSNFVIYPAAATWQPIGITMDTVKDTNQGIPVAGPGRIARLQFNDTVAAGALVASNNAGQGVPHVDTTAGSYVIGRLIGAAVALTSTVAEVLVMPFFKSIP